MSKRITEITFDAYRAFYEESTICLPNGENLLIYGENGSGKSSLYFGLYDFFSSSPEIRNHLKALEDEVVIRIEFKDGNGTTQEVIFPQYASRVPPFVADTNKLHSFLSYKELLKTYLIDPNHFEEQFFELLVNTILQDHQNPFTMNSLKADWEELKSSGEIRDKAEKLDIFNNGVAEVFREVNEKLQFLLNYFNHNIHAQLVAPTLTMAGQKFSGNAVHFKIDYFNHRDINHLNILNEARLSALALSIYFASILSNPTQTDYKILFLDDIFIGLDMSNRIPLLRILQDNFSDFQIFLTTYDRHWFEVAKLHLNTNWQAIEMYVGQKEGLDFEFPIIIAPSDDYYAKAEKYFHKKSGGDASKIDYPAAANYLRKECERLLKEKLFGKYLLKDKGDTGEIVLRQELGELKDMFIKMMKDFKMDLTPFQDFDIIIKTTLNPFSHDNLEKPIYKTELTDAFRLADSLRALRRVILPENELILLEKTHTNGTVRKTVLQIVNSDMVILKHRTDLKIRCNLKPLHYIENGQQTDLSHIPECGLNKAYDMICHNMYNQKNASQVADIYAEFRSETTGKTLKEMADAV